MKNIFDKLQTIVKVNQLISKAQQDCRAILDECYNMITEAKRDIAMIRANMGDTVYLYCKQSDKVHLFDIQDNARVVNHHAISYNDVHISTTRFSGSQTDLWKYIMDNIHGEHFGIFSDEGEGTVGTAREQYQRFMRNAMNRYTDAVLTGNTDNSSWFDYITKITASL